MCSRLAAQIETDIDSAPALTVSGSDTDYGTSLLRVQTGTSAQNIFDFVNYVSTTETAYKLDGRGDIEVRASSSGNPATTFVRSNVVSGSSTTAANGNVIRDIVFKGYDGTGDVSSAAIRAEVEESAVTTNQMGGKLVFSTTPDNSNTLSERMVINNAGMVDIGQLSIYPTGKVAADNTLDLDGTVIDMDSSTGNVDITAADDVTLTATGDILGTATLTVDITSTTGTTIDTAALGSGNTGSITLETGKASSGNAGGITLSAGEAVGGSAGFLSASVADTDTGAGGSVSIIAGKTTDSANGGDVEIAAGDGAVAMLC